MTAELICQLSDESGAMYSLDQPQFFKNLQIEKYNFYFYLLVRIVTAELIAQWVFAGAMYFLYYPQFLQTDVHLSLAPNWLAIFN